KQGITTSPVLIGPATYLTLGKVTDESGLDKFALADQLIPVYVEILEKLASAGAEWVQIDEPIFALDLNDAQRRVIQQAYDALSKVSGLKILVTNYFGDLRDNMDLFSGLPVAGLHIDAVRGAQEVGNIAAKLDGDKLLSVGVVDGRNIWKTDLAAAQKLLQQATDKIGTDRLMVGPSCSLLHSPVTLRNEQKLDAALKDWLAFAEEKLAEISFLARAIDGDVDQAMLEANQKSLAARRESAIIHDQAVQKRIAGLTEKDYQRRSPYAERARKQHAKLGLPAFPTTTIGSFPQTKEV